MNRHLKRNNNMRQTNKSETGKRNDQQNIDIRKKRNTKTRKN